MRCRISLHCDGSFMGKFHGFVIKYDNIVLDQTPTGNDNEYIHEGSISLTQYNFSCLFIVPIAFRIKLNVHVECVGRDAAFRHS